MTGLNKLRYISVITEITCQEGIGKLQALAKKLPRPELALGP